MRAGQEENRVHTYIFIIGKALAEFSSRGAGGFGTKHFLPPLFLEGFQSIYSMTRKDHWSRRCTQMVDM